MVAREAETTATGWTLMHTACYHGNYDIARWLAERGLDLFAQDNLRTTPLHCAAHSGNPELVRWLLQEGAQPRMQDAMGQTPIIMAKRR